MASIRCGKCSQTHASSIAVRACYGGSVIAPCEWLVKRTHSYYDEEYGWCGGEDGPSIEDCGAEAIYDDRGFACAAGHSHVNSEIRYAEGWDYAEDAEEASQLTRYGTEPRDLVTGGYFSGIAT